MTALEINKTKQNPLIHLMISFPSQCLSSTILFFLSGEGFYICSHIALDLAYFSLESIGT